MATTTRTTTTADLAVLGATVRTLDPARPTASAIAIRDGVIVAVGDDAEVRESCDARTTLIDGAGTAIVPGLVDSHIHPVWGAELTRGVDLRGLRTLDGVRDALLAERRRVGDGAWIRGWGLDYAAFAGRPIEAAAIAEAVAGAPTLLLFFDIHTALASPAALAAAGIDGPVDFPDASEVVCRDGVPTGELREMSAYGLILDAAPQPTEAEYRTMVAGTLRRLASLGLTGGHAMDGSPETFALLRELEASGDLPQRLVVPLWQTPDVSDEQIEAHLPLVGEHGRRWRGGVAKLFIDGVIDSGTAWLYEADTHGDGVAPFWPDPSRYDEVVARFAGAGFQCVTHACGDRGVAAALDAYRAADARPANGAPHRIEHLETMADHDLARLVAEDVVASMQPLHMQWRQADGSDSWTERLGPERTARAFRARDVLDAGGRLALGSDWPVAQEDPRLGMAWARLRRLPGQPDAPVFEPEQALTGLEALRGYSDWAAATIGEQDRQGRIAPGFVADLSGFAADPAEVAADELPALPVRLTVVDGEVVHRDEG
ncbi:amidohydrolase [Patulibacter defluvii]|uniref:amidohydrolase n=1 Tax=Patulibacter defluvii TaxID=3095358 RepID=UPI002A748C1C|nr:amidohydrolase family protein [Patulibacter sp. DM4]